MKPERLPWQVCSWATGGTLKESLQILPEEGKLVERNTERTCKEWSRIDKDSRALFVLEVMFSSLGRIQIMDLSFQELV